MNNPQHGRSRLHPGSGSPRLDAPGPQPDARTPRRGVWSRAVSLVLVGAVLWSCATTDAWLGDVPEGPRLTPEGDASAEIDGGDDGVSTLMCVATECPAPFTTCPSDFGPTYKCAVDPRRDAKHCGACGKECLTFEPIHMTSRCVEGACALECLSLPRYVFPDSERPTQYENCNGLLDDGCEVDVLADAANCGGCGKACAGGQPCIDGRCGCPNGLSACSGFCVNLASDDLNCGSCRNQCQHPDDACDPMPENTTYGCVSSTCGELKCAAPDFGDCDTDLGLGCASNGCETSLRDVNNCGACGRVCKPGEECREENFEIDCRPTCATLGLATCADGACADILNDPENCGGCRLPCPFGGPKQRRACEKGVCVAACAEGFGDCNGDPSDGCEVDLRAHPANCGACGVSCDLALGQPCVEGKCLVAPCEGSEAK
ncbi:MAG: hypothetical protein KF764_31685 [Labilithrix sp.]|nr:hypothetical protein [Labilithrix sp.]